MDWDSEFELPKELANSISEISGVRPIQSLSEAERIFLTGATGIVGVCCTNIILKNFRCFYYAKS